MKLTPILMAALAGSCVFAAHAAEPLRPLDPAALRVLGVSTTPAGPTSRPTTPAPAPALATPREPQGLVPLRLEGIEPMRSPAPERPTAGNSAIPSMPPPTAGSPRVTEPTKLVPMSAGVLPITRPELPTPSSTDRAPVEATPSATPLPPPSARSLVQAAPEPEQSAAPLPQLAKAEPRPAPRPVTNTALELKPAAEPEIQLIVPVDTVSTPAAAQAKPAPEPDAKPAAPSVPAQRWVASNGTTLKGTLQDWARRADWVVMWDDPRPDYEVIGTVATTGSFIDAVKNIFQIYNRSGAAYDVTLFAEQKLVLIRNSK